MTKFHEHDDSTFLQTEACRIVGENWSIPDEYFFAS
jgi:hypothetical protein